jgi:hypothetical protein
MRRLRSVTEYTVENLYGINTPSTNFESQIVQLDAENKSRVIKSQINENLIWLLHICELLKPYKK